MYLHIPFCVRKCPYCDFYSIADPTLIPSFVEALLCEIRLYRPTALTVDSLYFGGGTPSLLAPEDIGRIMAAVSNAFNMLPQAEITLEVNPGTVDADRLKAYRKLAVNRLNIGVQSFQAQHLRFLGRIHSAAAARRTIRDARDAGFENIGLDLIYGIPGQDSIAWRKDLQAAVAFAPEHLSCYMLTYATDTPLNRARLTGEVRPLGEGRVADLFRQTVDFLGSRGYRQYEISNFAAAENRQSRHNWKYWTLVPYLGLGPSAHSFKDAVRHWNVPQVSEYIDKLARGEKPIAETERLTRGQQLTEAIYLGLRTVEGLRLGAFAQHFGCDFKTLFHEKIDQLQKAGLARLTPDRFRLTRRGLLFLDSIVVDFDASAESGTHPR